MSTFDGALRQAVAEAIHKEIVPLLQPIIEHLSRLNVPFVLPTNSDDEPKLTTKDVATMLNLSPVTVEMWRYEGRGPDFVKVNGRSIRYRKSAVLQFIEANKGLLGRKGRPPQEKVEEIKRSGLVVDGAHSKLGRDRRSGKTAVATFQKGVAQAER